MKKSINLLIIDDSAEDAELLSLFVAQGGLTPNWHRVDDEYSLHDALSKQSWDTVLCDIRMPKLTPEKALDVIKKVGGGTPVIAVSGAVKDSEIIDLLQAGMRDFFNKDNLSRLAHAIRREMLDYESRSKLADIAERLRKCEELLLQGQKP